MAAQRRFRWGFLLLGLVLVGLIVWIWMITHKPPPPRKAASTSVSVAKVMVQDVPISLTNIGAAQAWQSDLINTQVGGMLTYVAPEGTDVRAGALLAQIEPSPYAAALKQAQGQLARDQALLAGAQVDLTRFQTLAAQDSIARQQVDDQAALVKQDQGTVLADQGVVATAQFNLKNCRITSPIDGRVGVRLIDPGNIVTTSVTTGIVTVNQITPIAVTFTVPQGDFQRLVSVSKGFTLPLTTQAYSQDTGAALGVGVLSVADNHVDPSTGTVELKAKFPNADKSLWPGEFVNVRLTLQIISGAITVPVAAVNQGPNGPYVYVVGADKKAVMRPVTLTATQDQIAIVQSGVNAGETVVTDGQMQLKPGAAVAIRQSQPAQTSAVKTPAA